MKLHITCREATEFIVKREEGKISFKQRIQLWMHIGICGLCKLFARQSRFIGKNSAHLPDYTNDTLTTEEKLGLIESLERQ